MLMMLEAPEAARRRGRSNCLVAMKANNMEERANLEEPFEMLEPIISWRSSDMAAKVPPTTTNPRVNFNSTST